MFYCDLQKFRCQRNLNVITHLGIDEVFNGTVTAVNTPTRANYNRLEVTSSVVQRFNEQLTKDGVERIVQVEVCRCFKESLL